MKILIIIMNFFYFFIKLFPTRNKITLISRQSNTIPLDFALLKKELEKDYKIVILPKKLETGIINKIKYVFHMFRQMYHIATSKVVILDSYCIAISNLKHKKSLKVIQIWHAMGSLKKFGYSIAETNTRTSALSKKLKPSDMQKLMEVMHMHKNYDYIFTSSKDALPYFKEAFGYDEKNMVIMPLPIVDLLTDDDYKKKKSVEIKDYYPIMKKKKNIVYVPTFRSKEKEDKIQELIDIVDYTKYNLIIKAHPLTKLNKHDERVIWDKNFSSLDMMIASDYIISDYSAIVYEASLLDKPLFFYTYDYKSYVKSRNFYIDYKKTMPGKICMTAKEVIQAINNNDYDLDKIRKFSKKNIELTNEKVVVRISKFIKKIIK